MNLTEILFIVTPIILIVGAVMTLKHSSTKFKLTRQQEEQIKKREAEQKLKDKHNE